MRIAWATPMSRNSAIARFSVSVTAELTRRGHDVEIFRTEAALTPQDGTRPTDLPVLSWEAFDSGAARRFDITFVNVGNNYPFHAGILPMLEIAPCIGVFHDSCLIGFFESWAAAKGLSDEEFVDVVVGCYGAAAEKGAIEAREGRLALDQIVETMPMIEWIAKRCAGAVAHARFYAPRLEAACKGPVTVAPLTIEPRAVGPPGHRPSAALVITTVGEVNINKRADVVIEAIGGSRTLRERVEYHLVGAISQEQRERLMAIAAHHDFDGLRMTGAVDDDVLVQRLGQTDIFCCLRKPVLEGASGSAIEALQSGRPTIVANVGFYAEIPRRFALRVPAQIPVEAVRGALEGLAQSAALRRRIGARARRWAIDHFGPRRYAAGMEQAAKETLRRLQRDQTRSGSAPRAFRWRGK